jgi:hypothetical protein
VSGPAFFQTRMGQVFFDVTMPKIADELGRVAASLAEIAKAQLGSQTHPPAKVARPRREAGTAAAPPFGSELMATLTGIAREHLDILTLEERKRDQLDVYDLNVKSVATALRAAYETGFAAGVAERAH